LRVWRWEGRERKGKGRRKGSGRFVGVRGVRDGVLGFGGLVFIRFLSGRKEGKEGGIAAFMSLLNRIGEFKYRCAKGKRVTVISLHCYLDTSQCCVFVTLTSTSSAKPKACKGVMLIDKKGR
jgi:hypothetical protein